jgi:cytoplasmic tRNA 2-thiolation protein 1
MMKTCNKCNRNPSVYFREYAGEMLCKKCFLNSIDRKVQRTINKFSMMKFGDHVAVATSGGKDSLVLLSILKSTIDASSGISMSAITIDEGISGYRDESLKIVSDFCSQLGVPLSIVSYNDLFGTHMDEVMRLRQSTKLTSCSVCGTFRRRAIDVAAEQLGANVIATAHNLDDEIQTFMINLFSGDVNRIGWNQASSTYKTSRMKKVKPLSEIYEREIAFYALQKGIPFQSEQCPYMNESIREEIRQFLNDLEKAHPGIKYNTYKSTINVSTLVRERKVPDVVRGICEKCGRDSTEQICSVCKIQGYFKRGQVSEKEKKIL